MGQWNAHLNRQGENAADLYSLILDDPLYYLSNEQIPKLSSEKSNQKA